MSIHDQAEKRWREFIDDLRVRYRQRSTGEDEGIFNIFWDTLVKACGDEQHGHASRDNVSRFLALYTTPELWYPIYTGNESIYYRRLDVPGVIKALSECMTRKRLPRETMYFSQYLSDIHHELLVSDNLL